MAELNRTRVRPPRPEPTDGQCCEPVLVGHFVNERLMRLYRRHAGRKCIGAIEPVNAQAWRAERGLR